MGAQTYNIHRATTSGKEVMLATGVSTTNYTDSAVTNGTTYFYTVTAVNANTSIVPVIPSESISSGEVQATPSGPRSSTATKTAVSVSANPSVFGQSVTFTAAVSPQTGSGTPTGSVLFVIDNGAPVTISLSGSDTATYTVSSLGIGKHTVTAGYTGDSTFTGSSAVLTQTVNPAPTATAHDRLARSGYRGVSCDFHGHDHRAKPGDHCAFANPTGTVTFFDGTTMIGQAPATISSGVVTASFGLRTLSPGVHTITASYSGDSNFAASTSNGWTETVNGTSTGAGATTTQLGSSADPSLFGQNVVFNATVTSNSGTPTGTVNFFDGSNLIGSGALSGGLATFTTANLSVGTHTISATYVGNSSFGTSNGSLPGGQTVNPAQTTTTLTSKPNPSQSGSTVTFIATITVQGPGSTAMASPTGTVTFADTTTNMTLGQQSVSSSGGVTTATFSTGSLGVGTHIITASYRGDTNFAASTSSGWMQTVNGTSTTATITNVSSSANPSVFGQSVLFTATITAGGGSGTPTGTVQFVIDGRSIGSPVSVSGSGGVSTASFSTGSLAVGTHTITASYSGDANFTSSNGTFTQMVQSGSTSTANVMVTLNQTTGMLSITGDSGNDTFTVMQSSPGVLQIAGVNTLINQSSSPASYAPARSAGCRSPC